MPMVERLSAANWYINADIRNNKYISSERTFILGFLHANTAPTTDL